MRVYLASCERHWKEFQDFNIRYVLLSFYHLRHNQHLGAMLEYLERLTAIGTKRNPSSVFLDSGVFSLKSGAAHMVDSALENYVDSYIEFLERPDTQHIELVAEVDVYQDLTNSDGEVLMESYDRVKQWRDRLYEAVGPRLVPVMAPDLTWDECEEICADARFNWVAMASLDPNEHKSIVSETCKYINLAHRYGKKVHLFGQTNTQTNFKYLQHADSCDSSTWVSSARHGTVFIHRRGRMDSIDHESKFRRKFYESYYKKIGCDYERILGTHQDHISFCDGPDSRTRGCSACADQAQESRKSALLAWRDFASFIEKRVVKRARETIIKSGVKLKESSNMTQETGKLSPKIRKSWKGLGVRPLYAEFGGFRCPAYRDRPLDVSTNLTCQNCTNFDMCKLIQEAESDHAKKSHDLHRRAGEGPEDIKRNLLPDAVRDQGDDSGCSSGGRVERRCTGGGGDNRGGDGAGGGRLDIVGPRVSRPVRRKSVLADPDVVKRWRPRALHMPSSTGKARQSYGEAVKAWLEAPAKFTTEELERRATKGGKETPHVQTTIEETQETRVPTDSPELGGTRPTDENRGVASHSSSGHDRSGGSVSSVVVDTVAKEKTHLPVIQDAADKALGVLNRVTPNFTCDTCTIEASCPKFAPGEICFFKAPLSNLDSRDSDSLLAMMEWGITMDFERTFMAATQERVQTGGQIDRRVSEQMNNFQRKARELLELKQNLSGADTAGNNQRGVTINNVQVSPAGPGLVARIFAAPPSPQVLPLSATQVLDLVPPGVS